MGFPLLVTKSSPKNQSPKRPPHQAAMQSSGMRRGEPPNTILGLLSHDQRNTQPRRKPRVERSQAPFKAATGKEARRMWKLWQPRPGKKQNAGQGCGTGEASFSSPAWLLRSFSCVAGSWPLKILAVVTPSCLLGPGNSSERLSVQFFICAIVPASPGPVPAPFLCWIGDNLSGAMAIT